MRKASLILLAMYGSLGCAGKRPQVGDGGLDSGSTGIGSDSTSAPPRFLFIGPVNPSDSVLWSGASENGSVLAGSSTFLDPATSTFSGVNFYWTAESGVLTLDPPGTVSPAIAIWPHVSPDGTSLFGPYEGGAYLWTKQTGYQLFAAPWPSTSAGIGFSRDGTAAWGAFGDSPASSGAFRWRRSDGLVYSGSLPGWPTDGFPAIYLQPSTCGGCGILAGGSASSDDGKVVAGYHRPSDAPGAQLSHGFIWREPGTFVELGPMPGTSACWVSALSRDGTTAFGDCAQDASSTPTAFRWTAATGMVPIGPTGDDVYYTDTTRDGRVAVGRNGTNTLSRWTADASAVRLQLSASAIDPSQYGISMTPGSLSDDGGSFFGVAPRIDFQPAPEEERPADGFRWSVADGFVLLAPLPGHDVATVVAAAPDGSVQVGHSSGRGGNPNPSDLAPRIVLWDCRGVRDVAAELAAGGIDLQGGGLTDVVRVWSGASVMILGYATVNGVAGAWIAWLPQRC